MIVRCYSTVLLWIWPQKAFRAVSGNCFDYLILYVFLNNHGVVVLMLCGFTFYYY